jgi:diacylglycerol kinase family enzyme
VKVSLLYNDRDGSGASLDRIRSAFTAHGHEVVRVITDRADFERLIDPPVDLVVSAGGDGTAANAARTVAGRAIPLAVLPLGTANNIARSLGYVGSIEELIGGLCYERRRVLDLGSVRGPWGDRTFVESVGGGMIAAGIEAMRARRVSKPLESAAARMERALRGYYEIVSRLEPRPCTLLIDGTPLEGEFLLVEVLNTAWIGPNISLSRDADPSDGVLSVVVAGENERGALQDYLEHRILNGDDDIHVTLTTYQARRVDLRGMHKVHVDDDVIDAPPEEPVAIHVEPSALEWLDPTVAQGSPGVRAR